MGMSLSSAIRFSSDQGGRATDKRPQPSHHQSSCERRLPCFGPTSCSTRPLSEHVIMLSEFATFEGTHVYRPRDHKHPAGLRPLGPPGDRRISLFCRCDSRPTFIAE